VSPAENVTYCHPSYAQSTPIMLVTPALTVAIEKCSGHQIFECAPRPPVAINSTDRSTMTPAFNDVETPWTSALFRVPRILRPVTTAIMSSATLDDPAGDSGTKTLT